MGLFRRKIKDPVRGTARVVAADALPRKAATWSPCSMELVIEAEGHAAYAHSHRDLMTPQEKWPYAGEVLPVHVQRDDASRVKILWSELPGADDRKNEQKAAAERLAESLREQQDRPDGLD